MKSERGPVGVERQGGNLEPFTQEFIEMQRNLVPGDYRDGEEAIVRLTRAIELGLNELLNVSLVLKEGTPTLVGKEIGDLWLEFRDDEDAGTSTGRMFSGDTITRLAKKMHVRVAGPAQVVSPSDYNRLVRFYKKARAVYQKLLDEKKAAAW